MLLDIGVSFHLLLHPFPGAGTIIRYATAASHSATPVVPSARNRGFHKRVNTTAEGVIHDCAFTFYHVNVRVSVSSLSLFETAEEGVVLTSKRTCDAVCELWHP